jgi:hypothetical protein
MNSVLGMSHRVVVGLKLNDWETVKVTATPYVPVDPPK